MRLGSSKRSRRARLGKADSLIDLGTGSGIIALGFDAYVGCIVGVDPEPAMLEAARQAAARRSQAFTLLESKAETLAADVGTYNVVTIGRALHWLEPEATGTLRAAGCARRRDSRLRLSQCGRRPERVARSL